METPTSPGWYDDPEDPTQLRYFDGVVWSAHRAPRSTRPAATEPTAQQGTAVSGAPANPQFPGAPTQQSWRAPSPGGPPGQYGQYGQAWGQPTTPDGQPLATYWQRVGAFVIDWIIQTVLGLLVGGVFLWRGLSGYLDAVDSMMNDVENGGQPDITGLLESIDPAQVALFTLVTAAVFAVYQVFFLRRSGQTPGKMACNIHVREWSRPGVPAIGAVSRRVGFAVVLFVAQLLPVVGALVLPARVVDLLWPAWDGRRQALHDKAAGTVVVVGKAQRDR